MTPWAPRRLLLACLLASSAALATVGCGGGGGGGGPAPDPDPVLVVGEVPPDFALPDVNAASPTFETDVAPSQWASYVTPWYFGWAT